MVCRAGLRLRARRRARHRHLGRRVRFPLPSGAAGSLRRHRMDRQPEMVERQGRRHRAVVLLHVAVVHGHPEPAAPGVPRSLRRDERPLPLPRVSRRDREQLSPVLVQRERARAQPVPGERRPPAHPGEGLLPRRAAPSELRRLLEGARRRGEPGENQGAGVFHRRVGQDGAASGRKYPRLPRGAGAEEALHHRHGECGHFADRFQQHRIPQDIPVALLRQAPEGQEDELRPAPERRIRREEHRGGALLRFLAAAGHPQSDVPSCERTERVRRLAQRRLIAKRVSRSGRREHDLRLSACALGAGGGRGRAAGPRSRGGGADFHQRAARGGHGNRRPRQGDPARLFDPQRHGFPRQDFRAISPGAR